MADDLTLEQRTAIGQRLADGRKRAAESRKDEPLAENISAADLASYEVTSMLDIHDPAKWQMKVRVHLESLDASTADEWVEAFRLITTMAARIARDKIHMQVTGRCYVCSKPFKMGRPEGEAGYYDRDGQYIKVYCCHQAEYPELLKMIMNKEQAVKAAEERTAKAVRQALIDVRARVERKA